jgi:anti-sigma B factor antagonist
MVQTLTNTYGRVKRSTSFACLAVAVQVVWLRCEAQVDISIRKAGSITILDLNGQLKLGESEQAFRQQFQNSLEQGARHIAVNLAGVSYIDSSGIGSLVRAFTQAKKAGARCTLFSPTKPVSQLIHMVRLDSILDIVDDEASALARS